MAGDDPVRSTWSEDEQAPAAGHEPDTSRSGGDPGYLTVTGQAAGEDGSVAAIIGGLPAVGGSARIPAPRWTSAAPAWLRSRAAHPARPAARTRAAAESRPAEDGPGHDSAPGACPRGVPETSGRPGTPGTVAA